MRTYLYDAKIVENYLANRLTDQEQAVVGALLLKDPRFQRMVERQRQAYDVIKCYGRKELKKELKRVDKRLLGHPDKINFQKKIRKIFGYE